MKNIINKIFDLHTGADDFENIIQNVTAASRFGGASLWILAFAIIIASVGLNMNSTAVIIGAMLISPLMGPIVAAGFGLAINDLSLVRGSLKHLLLATAISLIASTVYFFISPFKDANSEILARITPTIYDVIIAFFGGATGAVTITRKVQGNPIAGVAIATALMPPLCTAGFGIATGNYQFFLGAMYLYLINCFFIFLSTIIVVKAMKYEKNYDFQVKSSKRLRYLLTFIIIIMIIPSIYFGITLYQKERFSTNAEKYIEKEFVEKGHTVVYKKVKYEPRKENSIELAFLKTNFNDKQIDSINKILPKYQLNNTNLKIKSNNTQDLIKMRNDLMNEVEKSQRLLRYNDYKLDSVLKSIVNKTENTKLINEIQVIIPQIDEIAYEEIQLASIDTTSTFAKVVIYKSKSPLRKGDLDKLKKWVSLKYNTEVTHIFKAD